MADIERNLIGPLHVRLRAPGKHPRDRGRARLSPAGERIANAWLLPPPGTRVALVLARSTEAARLVHDEAFVASLPLFDAASDGVSGPSAEEGRDEADRLG